MVVICDVKFDTKYDQILQNSSQEPTMSSKYDFEVRVFLAHFYIMTILNVKSDPIIK